MHMLSFVAPVLYALFLWWFLTGLIMVVYGRSPRTVRLFFVLASLSMAGAVAGIALTRQGTDRWHVYVAVACGLVIWGWHTASYYLGFVTGLKEKRPLPRYQLPLHARFLRALRASLHHELLVIGFVLLLALLTRGQANQWGFWTFFAMWVMHLSAKVNVFLGVRNFYIDFLPSHLHHLERLLPKQASNSFLPLSVVIASSISLLFIYRAIVPGAQPADSVGYMFIGIMIALGVVEHLLLILPIPATIWGWGMRWLPKHPRHDSPPASRPSHLPLHVVSKQMIEG